MTKSFLIELDYYLVVPVVIAVLLFVCLVISIVINIYLLKWRCKGTNTEAIH